MLVLPALAFAQETPPAAPAAPAPAPAPATGQAGQEAPAADPRTTGNVGGHSYSDKPAVRTGTRRARLHKPTGPVVNLPGFEQLPDGGSRLFVQLSQNVPVEERRAQGTLTYILKGAHVRVWNNTNPLVTVHFNTPVARARLVPRGHDLHFVIDLRAATTPTWKMGEGPDKTALLTIDFPKGDFGVGPAAPAPKPNEAPPAKKPAAPAEPPPAPGPNP